MEGSGGVSQEARVKQDPGMKDPLGPEEQPFDRVWSENIMVKIELEDKFEIPNCVEDIKCEVKEIETLVFVKDEPTSDSADEYIEGDKVVRPKHLPPTVTDGLGASNLSSDAIQKPMRKRARCEELQPASAHESLSEMSTTNKPRAAHHEAGLQTNDETQDTDDSHCNAQQKTDLIRHQSAENHGATGSRQTDIDTQYINDYNCDTCGKTFPLKGDLIRHIQNAAAECIPLENLCSVDVPKQATNKAFWCEICEKQFRDSSDISRHRRTHTGDKPYECDVCKKQFAQASVLTRHRRIHTNEKPYSCNMCDKQFRASCDLTKHRRIHIGQKPVTCDICQKQLMGPDALTKHRRIHTGGKPHACQTCGKHFARTADLVIHTRIHTGEKPYSCEICKKRFARSYKLKEHTRIHTTPNPPRKRKRPAT